MRGLKRNEVLIYYCPYEEDSTEDEWGNLIGGYADEIEPLFATLSPNKGQVDAQGFGADLKYDREMVVHDSHCPINEFSRLWIDVETTKPHNYVVKKVAPSGNCIRYAIERVNVREAND